MAQYAVAHLDDIDELEDGRCPFRPVRHHFGITAFGVTAWSARAADRVTECEMLASSTTMSSHRFFGRSLASRASIQRVRSSETVCAGTITDRRGVVTSNATEGLLSKSLCH